MAGRLFFQDLFTDKTNIPKRNRLQVSPLLADDYGLSPSPFANKVDRC